MTFFTSITRHVKMFRYRSCVLYKSKKFSIILYLETINRVLSSYLEWWYDRTKYIISQHISFTVVISTERVNRIQLMQQLYRTVTIVKNIQTFNRCFNDRCTLLFYKSGIESRSVNIDRYSKLTALILQCQDC